MHLATYFIAGLSMGIYAVLVEYLFSSVKLDKWVVYLFIASVFCVLSSIIYALKVIELMKYSSVILASIVCFSILMSYSFMKFKDSKVLFFVAFIVGLCFKLNVGTQISYSVLYPLLSAFGYTGTMYTAIGNFGIMLQIFVESEIIFLAVKFTNLVKLNS